MLPVNSNALDTFKRAEAYVMSLGFRTEIDFQQSRHVEQTSESDFLSESAWVVLCSGFRERIVRKMFSHLSLCFCDWESASAILKREHLCRSTALELFAYPAKIDAILSIARTVAARGYQNYQEWFRSDPTVRLQELPFIGPITACHLAKNLGFDVAKPDRHLQRLAIALGFADAHQLCGAVSVATGRPKALIDSILWRYCEQLGTHMLAPPNNE